MLSPIVGRVMDARGPRIVILTGVAFMSAGLLLAPTIERSWQFYATLGVLVGGGANMMTYSAHSWEFSILCSICARTEAPGTCSAERGSIGWKYSIPECARAFRFSDWLGLVLGHCGLGHCRSQGVCCALAS
jgi:hypothetical protein